MVSLLVAENRGEEEEAVLSDSSLCIYNPTQTQLLCDIAHMISCAWQMSSWVGVASLCGNTEDHSCCFRRFCRWKTPPKACSVKLSCYTSSVVKFTKKKKKKEIRNHDPIQMSHLEEYLCLMGNCQNCWSLQDLWPEKEKS